MGGGVDIEKARAAKAKALSLTLSLLANAGQVNHVGVGITRVAKGHNGYGVKVNLDRRPRGIKLPDELDGVPLVVEVVGKIKKRKA